MEGFLRVVSLGKSGEAYNIGNDKPEVSVKDIYKLLRNITEKKLLVKLLITQNHIQMMNLRDDVQILVKLENI